MQCCTRAARQRLGRGRVAGGPGREQDRVMSRPPLHAAALAACLGRLSAASDWPRSGSSGAATAALAPLVRRCNPTLTPTRASRCCGLQIRQAYRRRVSKEHPDKGGDEVKFRAVQKAYDALVDDKKRRVYDSTGQVERSAEEDMLDAFGGGAPPRSARPALRAQTAALAGPGRFGARRDRLT